MDCKVVSEMTIAQRQTRRTFENAGTSRFKVVRIARTSRALSEGSFHRRIENGRQEPARSAGPIDEHCCAVRPRMKSFSVFYSELERTDNPLAPKNGLVPFYEIVDKAVVSAYSDAEFYRSRLG